MSLSAEQRKAVREAARFEYARRDLLTFIRVLYPGYIVNWHHRLLCDFVMRWLRGESENIAMVFCPPRHGKSEIVSRALPAFIQGWNPDGHVIAASYSANLAGAMSRDVARYMKSLTYRKLFPDTAIARPGQRDEFGQAYVSRADEWELYAKRGGYKGVGVGGGITGRGFNHGLIDDPIKSAEEAYSPTFRQKVWDWFKSDFMTRQQTAEAKVLITLTRWHDDDLAGRIIRKGLPATIFNLPAVAEAQEDHRNEGEALWPGRFPKSFLDKQKETLGPDAFDSLYQQRPTALGGGVIKTGQFRYAALVSDTHIRITRPTGAVETIDLRECLRWNTVDLAVSEKQTADYTVIGTWAGYKNTGDLFLLHVRRQRIAAPDQVTALAEERKRFDVPEIWIEKIGFQLATIQYAIRFGLPALELLPDKDKVSRTGSLQALLSQGNVWLVRADWNGAFLSECESFPNGEHDDQVDMGAYGGIVWQSKQRGEGGLADFWGEQLRTEEDEDDLRSGLRGFSVDSPYEQ